VKHTAVRIIFVCVLGVFIALGFREARIIGQFSRVSLRFETPINGEAARYARQRAIAYEGEAPIWLTFWAQETLRLATPMREITAPAIRFSGDAFLVWHAAYLAGSAPSGLDGYGIAVSYALAHQLWGSLDIIGKRLYVNNAPRTVRGIFEGTAPLALLPFHLEDTAPYWSAAELQLLTNCKRLTRENARQFALSAGLGMPQNIHAGGAQALARLMAWLPIIILIFHTAFLFMSYVKTYKPAYVMPLLLSGFIVFALVLPFLLNHLPPWLIPNQWSNFAFWANTMQQANEGLRDFLSTVPTVRDIEIKIHLLRQTGVFIFTLCSCVLVMRPTAKTGE